MQVPEKISAPTWRTLEAHDADEQAHNLRNWQQEYDQLSAGHFYGCIQEVALPSVHLFREHTSQALIQRCNVQPNALWLGFSKGDKGCRINGQDVATSELMVRPGHCDFELVTPAEFNIYGIVLAKQSLEKMACAQGLVLDQNVWASPRRYWDEAKLNGLRCMIEAAVQPDAVNAYQQDQILSAVLALLSIEPDVSREKPSFARRRLAVEQVKAYLREHMSEAITITDLCHLVHMSRRSLQYSFESILDISPLQYLRLSRLNAVHRELLAKGDSKSISIIAAEHGFWHASQFSVDYKKLFGETPTQTLQRRLQM